MEQILKKSHLLGTIKTTLLAVLVMLFIFLGIKSAFAGDANTYALFQTLWNGTDGTINVTGNFTWTANAALKLSTPKKNLTISNTTARIITGASVANPALSFDAAYTSTIQNVAFQGFTNSLTTFTGGVISLTAGTLNIVNTLATAMEFKNNKHGGRANDITMSGATTYLYLKTNASRTLALRSGIKATGGYIYLDQNLGTLILGGVIDVSNVAGGLIVNQTNAILKIENATGTFNVGSGARIYFNGGQSITGQHLEILNSSITFLNATSPGTGMFLYDQAHHSTHSITNSYLRVDNSMNPNAGGSWGAITFRGDSYNSNSQNWLKIVNSTAVFHGNRAGTGGAMLLSSNNTFFTLNSNITFSSNTTTGDLGGAINSEHGGRIYFVGGKIEFTGNKSGSSETGGAVGMKGSFAIFEKNTLIHLHDNVSGTYGGAIDMAVKDTSRISSLAFINTNALISSNSTTNHGGGVSIRGGSQLWIQGGKVVIVGNTAGVGYGGGLYVGRGGDNQGGATNVSMNLRNGAILEINQNILPGTGGGGVYLGLTAIGSITSSTMTFTANNAYLEGGGMLIASNANVTFTTSYLRFYKNKTQMHGGGISLTGSFASGESDAATILNISGGKTFFELNVSGTGYGGGIYVENLGATSLKTFNVTNAAIITFAENTLTGGERVGDFKA
jgi:predicted outer membrane repeat protein